MRMFAQFYDDIRDTCGVIVFMAVASCPGKFSILLGVKYKMVKE